MLLAQPGLSHIFGMNGLLRMRGDFLLRPFRSVPTILNAIVEKLKSGNAVSRQRFDVNLPPDPILNLMAVAIRWAVYTILAPIQARSRSRPRRAAVCEGVVNG